MPPDESRPMSGQDSGRWPRARPVRRGDGSRRLFLPGGGELRARSRGHRVVSGRIGGLVFRKPRRSVAGRSCRVGAKFEHDLAPDARHAERVESTIATNVDNLTFPVEELFRCRVVEIPASTPRRDCIAGARPAVSGDNSIRQHSHFAVGALVPIPVSCDLVAHRCFISCGAMIPSVNRRATRRPIATRHEGNARLRCGCGRHANGSVCDRPRTSSRTNNVATALSTSAYAGKASPCVS